MLYDTDGTGEIDRQLAKWVQERIPRCLPFQGNIRSIGIVGNGQIVAAAVYTDLCTFADGAWTTRRGQRIPYKGGGNVYINFAADAQRIKNSRAPTRGDLGITAPHWATRKTIQFVLSPPFLSWGCNRITAITDRKFLASKKLLLGVGFTYEGVARQILPDNRDAVIYGLLKSEFLGGRFGPRDIELVRHAA